MKMLEVMRKIFPNKDRRLRSSLVDIFVINILERFLSNTKSISIFATAS